MKKALLHLIVLSCRRASFLIEKQQEKQLSFIHKKQLELHLKICSKCFIYQNQSHLITKMLQSNHKTTLIQFKLPEESKARFQKALEEKMKK